MFCLFGNGMVPRWHGIRTDFGVELGVVEVLDNLLDGRDSPVPSVHLSAIAAGRHVSRCRMAVATSCAVLRAPDTGAGHGGATRHRIANCWELVGNSHLEVAADEKLASHFEF
jgi:hypothetical protein